MPTNERRELTLERQQALSAQFRRREMPLPLRAATRLKLLLEEETVTAVPGERIPGRRTIISFPDIYLPGEREALQKGHYVHEQGRVCNISSDWAGVLREGLLPRREAALQNLSNGVGDADFLNAAVCAIDAVLSYGDRYRMPGLSRALRRGAGSFLEALQAMRILHLSLWASNVYHNTVGRFDQYMLPYYERDVASGALSDAEALALIEEFFLSFNRDSDLYTGMQQGDNGQSLMLGGCDREGRCAVNRLTYLCLNASLNNRRIDPKINLRVDQNTPLSLYEKCTELTRQGLGFPQYSNDDVVIPALVRFGYSLEDARDYTVAACWEFIIPGVGMDIPNIGAVCLATAVDDCVRERLAECADFDALARAVGETLRARAAALSDSVKNLFLEPAPYQSILMRDCVKQGRDISRGAKYNNYGVHGTGIADAVDQLAAIKQLVYDEKALSAQDFLNHLADGFARAPGLLERLRNDTPRMGRDPETAPIAEALLNAFADAFEGLKNERKGIFRPGTGSAMYYVWHARGARTLSDGHKPGENFSANFSPSLLLTDAGPLSVIRAFSLRALPRVCNGGPLTLELHDAVFRNAEGIRKVARLVQTYVLLGGHQLQLNAVSRETLLAARACPEEHQGLIVRVWGWSGHFVQLDQAYQDQIIARTSYQSV